MLAAVGGLACNCAVQDSSHHAWPAVLQLLASCSQVGVLGVLATQPHNIALHAILQGFHAQGSEENKAATSSRVPC